jgi:hypothetical protein
MLAKGLEEGVGEGEGEEHTTLCSRLAWREGKRVSCKDETRQQTLESRGQYWNKHGHGRTKRVITIAS